MRIGIDVGGTNTDAVAVGGGEVLAWTKTPTTTDVMTGVRTALADLAKEIDVSEVQSAVIGTTHFVNALLEARRLAPVGCVRLASPPQTLMPLVDWPDELRSALGGHAYVCRGGHQFDGKRMNELDVEGLRAVAQELRGRDVAHVALSGTFSPVNPEDEERAAEILREAMPDVAITSSHEIGSIGMLERENAAALNASLQPLAEQVVAGFIEALQQEGITAPLYLSQNDGTLMDLDRARRFPIFTVASGPTNSMRGAASLSGVSDSCIVIDVGGTSSDFGVLQKSFPREASVEVLLAGVRTNFRMPDVYSIAIGGGSIVHEGPEPHAGPESVGYELTTRARVFGGDTLTLTDIAVSAGIVDIGDRSLVADLDPTLVKGVQDWLARRFAEAVDTMKLSGGDTPVVVVGGGGFLVDADLVGASAVTRPENGHVANAIGAARARAGGEVDRIYSLASQTREEILEAARREAIGKAVDAGARPESVEIVDTEDVPLTHLPGGTATRVRVRAVGDVDLDAVPRASTSNPPASKRKAQL